MDVHHDGWPQDAAALDGSGWLGTLGRVVFPLCARGLAVAWFLAFVLSLGEVGTTVPVTPPGFSTLTIHFYTQIHTGVYLQTASTCVLLLLILLPPAAALTVLLGRRLKAPRR